MKKIMIAGMSALVLSTSAMAEQRPQHHRHHHHHNGAGPYYLPHSSSGAMFGLGFGMTAPRPYYYHVQTCFWQIDPVYNTNGLIVEYSEQYICR